MCLNLFFRSDEWKVKHVWGPLTPRAAPPQLPVVAAVLHARLLPVAAALVVAAAAAAVRGLGACRPGGGGVSAFWTAALGSGGCMWEEQRAGPAARRVCHGLGAGGGLDWRRGLEGRSHKTLSRVQLKFLKDDLRAHWQPESG